MALQHSTISAHYQPSSVDIERLAEGCRAAVLQRYSLVNSCIETAYLLERTAFHCGVPVRRMVCQATAFSPLMAKAISDGVDIKSLAGREGYWAVGVGACQHPGDFVGLMQIEKNRFVGHVVCVAGDVLVDPSADQMSRPAKGLHLPKPVFAAAGEGAVIVAETPSGAIVRYVLHPDVRVPQPKTDRLLERMALRLAGDLRALTAKRA